MYNFPIYLIHGGQNLFQHQWKDANIWQSYLVLPAPFTFVITKKIPVPRRQAQPPPQLFFLKKIVIIKQKLRDSRVPVQFLTKQHQTQAFPENQDLLSPFLIYFLPENQNFFKKIKSELFKKIGIFKKNRNFQENQNCSSVKLQIPYRPQNSPNRQQKNIQKHNMNSGL